MKLKKGTWQHYGNSGSTISKGKHLRSTHVLAPCPALTFWIFSFLAGFGQHPPCNIFYHLVPAKLSRSEDRNIPTVRPYGRPFGRTGAHFPHPKGYLENLSILQDSPALNTVDRSFFDFKLTKNLP